MLRSRVLDRAPSRGVRGKIFVIVDPCDGFLGVIHHILEFLDKYFLLTVGLSLKATRRRSVKGVSKEIMELISDNQHIQKGHRKRTLHQVL